MRLAEYFFLKLKRLAVYSLRLSILTLATKRKSEVAYGRKRWQVYLTEHLFRELERLAVYGLYLSILALAIEYKSEVTYSRKRRRVHLTKFTLSYL